MSHQQVTPQPTTLLHLNHATDLMTSKHITSKHMTSQPWNGRRLVHTKKLVWASRWSVALRTFYRQILSLLYSSFSLLKLPPPARPGTACMMFHSNSDYTRITTHIPFFQMKNNFPTIEPLGKSSCRSALQVVLEFQQSVPWSWRKSINETHETHDTLRGC